MNKTIWLYGRESGKYMWGNLGQYQMLDKGLLVSLYGAKNLLCVMSEKSILSENELKQAPKWHINYAGGK